MEKLKKRIKDKSFIAECAIVLIVFITIFILNRITEYTSDDFHYHFFFDTAANPGTEVKRNFGLIDVILSQINHWKIWNGRVVAHGLLQLVLQGGKLFFDIVNSVMYVLLGVLIYKHATLRQKNISLLIGIYLMMWFFIPQFGATCLWASGSANYLWMAVITLLYLLPYRQCVSGEIPIKDNALNIVLISALGLFAGCTNENGGGTLVMACILSMCYCKLKEIKIPVWFYCGVVTSAIGMLIMVKAPGNYRIDSSTDLMGLISRFKDIFEISQKLMFWPLVVLAVVMILLARQSGKGKFRDYPELLSLMYILPALASIGVLIFAAMHPERTWFIGMTMTMCAIGFLYNQLDLHQYRKYIPIAVITVIFTFSYVDAVNDNMRTYKQIKEGLDIIEQAKKNDIKTVEIPCITPSDNGHDGCKYSVYINESSDSWVNAWMAKYYEIDYINGYK